jgi:rhodanese-related sulfurtransferase
MVPIQLPQLVDLLESEDEWALFDVREAGEAHRGHLPDASFLPRRQIELRIAALVPRLDTPIVVYDDGGTDLRAARAVATLNRLGYAHARTLEGGTSAWVADGRRLGIGSNVRSKLFGETVHETRQVPRLKVQELKSWIDAGRPHTVCDIRSPEEYARAHIPGARGAFGTELALLAADLRDGGRPVVVHCSGRTRSIIACQSLRELGVPEVYALENGTMGWQLAGYALEQTTGAGVLVPGEQSRAEGEAAAHRLGFSAGARPLPPGEFEAWMQSRSEGRANLYPIDVRQLNEYADGHVPGTLAVPGGLAIQRADEFVPVRAARIVFIDTIEARAWLAACWFRRMGYPNVHVLEGGIAERMRSGDVLARGSSRAAPAGWAEAQRHARTMTPAQLQPLAATCRIVNVDTSAQFAKARLPGSTWIPYGDFEDKVAEMRADDRHRLVLTCRDGTLSTLAAANLARQHIDVPADVPADIRVLAGGVAAWAHAGNSVDTGIDPAAQPAGDLVVQPYDAGPEAMARYLAWEQQLTKEISNDRNAET